MDRFLILANSEKDVGLSLSKRISKYISEKGGTSRILARDSSGGTSGIGKGEVGDAQLALVLGGDGTMVRASRDLSDLSIPMIGINLGTLGYLCEVEEAHVFRAVDDIFLDDFSIEDRLRLRGDIFSEDGKRISRAALNDIVCYRSGSLQIASINVYVNERFLCNYYADGLIIATPTGSTAYSMSAGGPIIDPGAGMLLITPINAQAMTARSIVIGEDDKITVEAVQRHRGKTRKNEECDLAFDGDYIATIGLNERIVIRKAPVPARFLKLSQMNFIERLQRKMG